jgi:hypothetical protein
MTLKTLNQQKRIRFVGVDGMKSFLIAVLLWPAVLLGQSPIDGTWVVNMDSIQFPQQPETYSLQNGEYQCSTCVPAIKVKADGQDHMVSGSPYFSTIAVRIVNPKSIEITEKLREKTVYLETDTVASDGNTLTEHITDSAALNGSPLTATETFKRVNATQGGSNSIAGSWQPQKIEGSAEKSMSVTYRSQGDRLEASNPSGEGYSAKFDGKEYPIHGEPSHSTVSLQRVDANTIVETDKQDGSIHYQVRMTVSSDGRSMQVTETDNERGVQTSYTMEKQ